jgi:anti-sigma regulatory factor (Ser/Thr protein kinase)
VSVTRLKTFPAEPSQLTEVRRFVRTCAMESGYRGELNDLLLAVSEAAANAVAHSGSTEFRVTWRLEGDGVEVTVDDDGKFRRRAGASELDGIAHRGLQIIAATMDEVQVVKGGQTAPGTRVRLVQRAARE